MPIITDPAPAIDSLINTGLWYIAFAILIPVGIYFTIRIKGAQITKIPETLRILKSSIKEKISPQSISGFQAFCTTMGTRIGIGNIAGVAAAIVMGGPGTIFWMWVFAIILAAVSFTENTIGQLYKQKDHKGMARGGPAYYIRKGLGKPKFAILMSVLLIILAFSYCGVQANQACACVIKAFPSFDPLLFGLLLTGISGLIFFGGVKRVAKISEIIVPIMTICYLGLVLAILITNIGAIGGIFSTIFTYAFGIRPFVGGGAAMMFLWALKRTVFSTDTGVGMLTHVTASVDTKHPITVGLSQAFGTLFDMLICTASGFVVLLYTNQVFPNYNFTQLGLTPAEFDGLKGTPLVSDAFSSTFLGDSAPFILSLFILVFAFSTLITHYVNCEANTLYITKKAKALFVLRILLLVDIFIGSQLSLGVAWDIADSVQALLCIINLIVLALLSKPVFEALRDYKKQKKSGILNPVFTVDKITRKKGVTEWDPEDSKK